jgi:hypothetical protein
MTEHPLERFLPLLVSGDGTASEVDLGPESRVLDPQAGVVLPEVLPFFLPSRYMWLAERHARVENVGTVRSDARVVVEQVLYLVIDGKRLALPVALAGETDAAGKLVQVRIYHAIHPLTGRHDYRAPLLETDETIVLPEPIATVQGALARGDIDAILALFAEPADADAAIGELVGMALFPCTMTDDGARCAIEYNRVRQRDSDGTIRPGLVVFERAGPRTLRAARIYDDVESSTR